MSPAVLTTEMPHGTLQSTVAWRNRNNNVVLLNTDEGVPKARNLRTDRTLPARPRAAARRVLIATGLGVMNGPGIMSKSSGASSPMEPACDEHHCCTDCWACRRPVPANHCSC